MFIECDDSDGLTGFYYSHDGYWTGGNEIQGSKTKVECANTCMHDCFGFHTYGTAHGTASTGSCYHYSNRAILVSANMKSFSNTKAYVKCSGRYE